MFDMSSAVVSEASVGVSLTRNGQLAEKNRIVKKIIIGLEFRKAM
jgi:hypothetical protein